MSKQAGPEKTFRSCTDGDAAKYAQARMKYGEALYQALVSTHTKTGGKLETVLDVGCGPGTATLTLARYFPNAIGLDPSEGMINTARSVLASSPHPPGSNIKFLVSTAEDIDSTVVPNSTVDLITAASCAHWFDMPRFWTTAARVLRPGGSVALWCSNAGRVHPSMPNAAVVNAAIEKIEEEELVPFFEPGSWLTRELYAKIELPWTVDPPVTEFDKDAFFRREWGVGGNDDAFFEQVQIEFDLGTMEKMLGTTSPVTRWRQAYPDAVGTEKDVVIQIRRVVEKSLHEAGMVKGKEWVRASQSGVLLVVKKRQSP